MTYCAIAYSLHTTTNLKITLSIGFVPQAQKEIEFCEIIVPQSRVCMAKQMRARICVIKAYYRCIVSATYVGRIKSLGKILV